MSKFDEYEKNPDSMDLNEDNVEALIKEMGEGPDTADAEAADAPEAGSTDDAVAQEASKEADKSTDGEDQKAAKGEDKGESGQKDAPTKQVIKTRDGKHEIPYSVLEDERNRAKDLQRQLDEIRAAQQKQPEPVQQAQDTGASADTDEFDLDAYREEFGDEAAKAEQQRRERYSRLEQRQAQLEQELTESKKWRADQEARAQESVESQINEAIDSIDELREWRDSKDPMWDAAVALDNRLMQDPEFKDKSFRDRFTTVVERLTGKKVTQEQQDNIESSVDQKLAEKEKGQRSAPNSLSDLPGGTATDQSENDTLDRMTTAQLEAKLSKMTPDEQEAYLSRL